VNSTLLILYRSIVIGLIAGSCWAVAAYGRAYWTTRLADYRVMALAMLSFTIIAIFDITLLSESMMIGFSIVTLPYIISQLMVCFSPKPTLKFPGVSLAPRYHAVQGPTARAPAAGRAIRARGPAAAPQSLDHPGDDGRDVRRVRAAGPTGLTGDSFLLLTERNR
jgi:hypothetical protein